MNEEFPNLPDGVTVELIDMLYLVRYKDQLMSTPMVEEVYKYAHAMIVLDRHCDDCE